MTKWADYLISAVTYDSERQIISLKRHRDSGDEIGPGELIDKASVASDIDNGLSYMTIFSTLSNWKLGKKIRSSRVDNHYCLRIDDNKVKHDNLGQLPDVSEISTNDEPQKHGKKISNEIPSQISPDDKAMLKNMGAQHNASIASIKAKPETTSIPELSEPKQKSKSKILLTEYEKDYLERIGLQEKITSESKSKEITESPHGTLPKGFDESSPQETKPEPPKPEITESPHGTLPKEQEKNSKQKTEHVQSTSDEQSKELYELEKQIGDLKKAVDELDESKTSESSDKNSAIQAYCVKCKSKRDIKNPIQSELKNGRPAIKGVCSVCETRVCRIGKLK